MTTVVPESADQARARMTQRRGELVAELARLDRELAQLDTTVIVSRWWTRPSGPGSRGTAYHRDVADIRTQRCSSASTTPERITLYEALKAGLNACQHCVR